MAYFTSITTPVSAVETPGDQRGGIKSPINLAEISERYLRQKYQDKDTGEINNVSFYDEALKTWRNVLSQEDQLTNENMNQVIKKITELSDAKVLYDSGHKVSPLNTMSELNNSLNSAFTELWKTPGLLKNQSVSLMTTAMLDKLDIYRAEFEGLKNNLQSYGLGEEQTRDIDVLVEEVKYRQQQWRGIENNPTNYAVGFQTNNRGEVEDVKVFPINSVPDKFKKTGSQFGGLQLYGIPNTITENGENQFQLGNNIWKGDKELAFDSSISGVGEPDYSLLHPVLIGGIEPGKLIKSSLGKYYLPKEDGTYDLIPNDEIAKKLNLDIGNAVPLTDNEIRDLETSATITEVDSKELQLRKVQQLQSQLNSANEYSDWSKTPGGAVRLGLQGTAEQIGTGIKNVFQSQPVKEIGGQIKEMGQSVAQTASAQTIGKVFTEGVPKVWQSLKKFGQNLFSKPQL